VVKPAACYHCESATRNARSCPRSVVYVINTTDRQTQSGTHSLQVVTAFLWAGLGASFGVSTSPHVDVYSHVVLLLR